jgi:hypothetical protein
VTAVGAALTRAEQVRLSVAPTKNPDAYILYMQGREYRARPGYRREDLEAAQQLFERALALDPGFALAHAALANTHGDLYWFYDTTPARLARERKEAEAALRLAPNLAGADDASIVYVTSPFVGTFYRSASPGAKAFVEVGQDMRQFAARQDLHRADRPIRRHREASCGKLRTNQVFILGDVVRPGGYTISSVSTVLNALYNAGGPTPRGSMRDVRIIRHNDLYRRVDLYGYILTGSRADDVRLQLREEWRKYVDAAEKAVKMRMARDLTRQQLALIDQKMERMAALRAKLAERIGKYDAAILQYTMEAAEVAESPATVLS